MLSSKTLSFESATVKVFEPAESKLATRDIVVAQRRTASLWYVNQGQSPAHESAGAGEVQEKSGDQRTGKAKRHGFHVRLEGEDLRHIRRHRDDANIPEINRVATILGPIHSRHRILAFST